MKLDRLTHLLLGITAAVLLWNAVSPGGHPVHAASAREYMLVPTSFEKMDVNFNTVAHDGWAFKWMVQPSGTSQYLALFERER